MNATSQTRDESVDPVSAPVLHDRSRAAVITRGAIGGCTRILLIVAALAGVLAADVHTSIVGQTVVGLVVWLILFSLLTDVDRDERFALMACLVIATAGEMFLSLVWGLYTYRLGNIPLFVPPGHVLMLLLGFSLARRMPEAVALAIIGCAGVYSLAAAEVGVDTLGVLLFLVLAAASLTMPNHRRLYASTFVLALALELYGTWLGNWSWAREVPGMPLVTTNPPGAAGAFYCALDALVVVTSMRLASRLTLRPQDRPRTSRIERCIATTSLSRPSRLVR